MTVQHFKTLVLAALFTTLSACGGGSGGDNAGENTTAEGLNMPDSLQVVTAKTTETEG